MAAQTADAALKLVHLPSPALESLGAPATHILGESFSTVAPIRYGSYVAKIGFAPASENLKTLTGKHVDLGADYNALEERIKHFFPWHALAAHQPLGNITSSRLKAYEEAHKYRAQRNNRTIAEPKSIDEVPA